MQPTGTSKAEAQCLTTPLPLAKFLGQILPICQLLDLDLRGVWGSTHLPLVAGAWTEREKMYHFLSWKRVFSSLSEWALPMPETKIWDHFSIQIYPLLVGNMASETTFGHWKVVFSWGKGRKMTFSQKPLNSRFWASGFWMSILSSANFKKDPPWKIFFLSVHAPATSGCKPKVLWVAGLEGQGGVTQAGSSVTLPVGRRGSAVSKNAA